MPSAKTCLKMLRAQDPHSDQHRGVPFTTGTLPSHSEVAPFGSTLLAATTYRGASSTATNFLIRVYWLLFGSRSSHVMRA